MAKRIILGVIGVVVGIVLGMIAMMGFHLASTLLYPLPEDVSFFSQDPANVKKMNGMLSKPGSIPRFSFSTPIGQN